MATIVALVTVTISGVFNILPNRTIAIAKATIHPSLLPVPVYTETPPPISSPPVTSTFISTPTSTSASHLVLPPAQSQLDNTLLIALVCGIVGPILLCITGFVILRFLTWRLATLNGISFSPFTTWITFPESSPKKPRNEHTGPTKVPAPPRDTSEVAPPAERPHSETEPYHPLAGPGGQGDLYMSGPFVNASDEILPVVPPTVQPVMNEKGEIFFRCRNHPTHRVERGTWICSFSHQYLDEELRFPELENNS
ncbi:hypothetical protein GQ44DRAFT_774551 [Phaeosphaeriaceae sp. PMI808]|nr:hypothetical protein GQ44DRAFT_774551 [Phaeosphaeriaceae sp. PMI808]